MLNNWQLRWNFDCFVFGIMLFDVGLGIFFGPFLLVVGCGGEEND